MKIKVGISGAHSTGKTSFIKALTEKLTELSVDYKIVSDLASLCPLPILRNHTVESTLWIAAMGIAKEVEAEKQSQVIISDRSLIDSWAYFQYACKDMYDSDNPKLMTLKSMIEHWMPTYSILYQTVVDADIPIENIKGRDLDINYRRDIESEFYKANSFFKIVPRELTSKNKTVEIENILDYIKLNSSKR